jgi:beta-lactamase superfamily II metal-dependent hydrolase
LEERFARADDQTLVLKFDWHGIRLLFCSDLGRLGQETLLEREPDLEVDIVVSGMPNGEEPLGEALLEVLRPKVIVLSTGRYPGDQEPSRSLRQRLARWGVPVFLTGDQGAVCVSATPYGWNVRAADSEVTGGAVAGTATGS